jgi:hypothetical protein
VVCDYLRKLGDRFSRRGQPSGSPAAGLTLDDLVEEGQLTPVQAQELRETLVLHQSNYPAGTRYSVFG